MVARRSTNQKAPSLGSWLRASAETEGFCPPLTISPKHYIIMDAVSNDGCSVHTDLRKRRNMRNLSVKKLTMAGVMAALVFVMTYVPKVPVPVTGGYVHLGDGAIFLSVLLLGPLGIPAAAIG